MAKIVNIDAIPNTGWEFENWTNGGSVISTEPTFDFELTEDTHLVANFKKKIFLVTIGLLGSGTVSGDGSYQFGDEVTVTATPDEHNKFIGWFIGNDLISTDEIFTFIIDDNMDLVAKFEELTYVLTLEANPTEGGTVNGAGTY